ncbi:Os07g0531101 [Oryza sativa Japonica Group]|uniref:Os07g0531101 protein n=1 Tax=Oryza sativa subsp. japonica TaxID=39947 RepID=A0A0P0X6W5_ORYSJ|nr:Os07g0531101 [Oryza sativa Japonica Group]
MLSTYHHGWRASLTTVHGRRWQSKGWMTSLRHLPMPPPPTNTPTPPVHPSRLSNHDHTSPEHHLHYQLPQPPPAPSPPSRRRTANGRHRHRLAGRLTGTAATNIGTSITVRRSFTATA